MSKLKLIDPETGKEEIVNLILRFRKAAEFERKNKDVNIIKFMAGNGGIPNFESMIQMLYIGYTGGLNKTKYTYDEFIDRIYPDLNESMLAYQEMVSNKKN